MPLMQFGLTTKQTNKIPLNKLALSDKEQTSITEDCETQLKAPGNHLRLSFNFCRRRDVCLFFFLSDDLQPRLISVRQAG